MKKILPLALALALAACAAPAQPAPEAPAPSPAPVTAGRLFTVPRTTGTSLGWNTGTACYELAQSAADYDRSARVLKTDYAAAAQTPVCAVPGCTHDSERCPAWLPNGERHSLLVLGEEVFLLYTGFSPAEREALYGRPWEEYWATAYDSIVESGALDAIADMDAYKESVRADYALGRSPGYLDKISADGAARSRVFTLSDARSWNAVDFQWCDGAALYGVQYGSNHTSALVRLDLATGELTTLPLRDTEWPVAVSGNRFLISSVVSDEPLDWNSEPEVLNAQLQNATAVFSLLDVAADTREVVYQEPYDPITVYNGFSRIYNGKLYFLRVSTVDNTIDRVWVECYDPADGQLHPVTDSLGTSITAPGTASGFPPVRAGAGNRWMWLENYMTNEDWLLDLDTGELHEITQRQLRDGMWQTVSTMAQTNDGRWMIGYAPHSAAHNDRCDYGFIAPEDFLAGSEAYDNVAMWP